MLKDLKSLRRPVYGIDGIERVELTMVDSINSDDNILILKETLCKGCVEVERAFLNGEADSVATTTAHVALRKGLSACKRHVESVVRDVGQMNQDVNDVMDGWPDQFFEVLRLLCFSPGWVCGCHSGFFSLILLCAQTGLCIYNN